ncbi:MAG: amidohydrolase [Candidatus Heimdallarchaeaceae archaeon]
MKIFHGTIITCDNDNNVFNYLVEEKGKILFVGDSLPPEFKNESIIELGEKALLPAFADTHIHFSNWAFFAYQLYFQNVSSLKDIKEQLQSYAKRTKTKVIIGFGISAHNVKEKRLPTRQDLDEWCPDKPVMLVKYDGHASVVNTAMLSKFPESIKNLRGFNADTGHLYQEAYYEGTDFATNMVSPLLLAKNMLKGIDRLAKRGIGMLHAVEGVGFPRDLDVDLVRYIARGQKEGFQFRIFFQTLDVKKVLKRKLPRIGGCFATALDGCFGSEDAALMQPYSTSVDNTGVLFYSDEKLLTFTKEAHKAGLQIEFHAIGDAAFEQAIRVLEAAIRSYPREDHRHTIIHASLPTEEGLKKCAELGICLAVQPSLLTMEEEPVEYLKEILGERYKNISPFRTMLDLGIKISGGSDGPVTRPDPIKGIYSACNHFVPEQSLTIQEALRMFTIDAAYMSFDEKERGSLEAGKIADMVILNKNPLVMEPSDLLELKVEDLYLQGQKYKGKQSLFSVLLRAFSRKGRRKII